MEAEPLLDLSARKLAVAALLLLGAVLALHFTALAAWPKPELDALDLSDFYPLSVFRFRLPTPYQVGLMAAYAGLFLWLWPRLARGKPPLAILIAAGLAFAVLSNLAHGFRYGLDFPTATNGDGGIEYYHDALVIPGPLWLVQNFNAVQFELLEHSRTHPPGPVLLYWLLHVVLRHPAAISVGIAALALALTLPFLRRLLSLTLGDEPEGALALFSILPAMLVYGLATVDAPIAGLFLGALVSFLDERRPLSWLWAICFLFAALFFTFGALFLLPVMVGFELLRRRRVTRSLLVIGSACALLLLLRPLFGFDWLTAFFKTCSMENPRGFMLLAESKRYLWYRLGALAELAVFLTPFLGLLWLRGFRQLAAGHADAFALAWLGPASLAALLLTGALRIGEAARICLFILPYLFLPVVAAFRQLSAASRARVARAVLGYGIVLQLFGFYQW